MPTFLFHDIIFGPLYSRRLGASLGINLLPIQSKFCNFNCLYCECGFTSSFQSDHFGSIPTQNEIIEKLRITLKNLKKNQKHIDTITFAGNGEPTLHPCFPEIIDHTLSLRDEFFPRVKIAVLSNATQIYKDEIKQALLKVDLNILKLDSANENTIKTINCPQGDFSLERILSHMPAFKNNLVIQSLFVRGEYKGMHIDNSSDEEVDSWIELIRKLNPRLVMVYTIDRDTPVNTLYKVDHVTLKKIASKVRKLGIPATISS